MKVNRSVPAWWLTSSPVWGPACSTFRAGWQTDPDPGKYPNALPRNGQAYRTQRGLPKNKSFSVSAEVEVGVKPVNGVIIAQGGRFGGWSVYAKEGKLKFVYNVLGIHEFPVEATELIP